MKDLQARRQQPVRSNNMVDSFFADFDRMFDGFLTPSPRQSASFIPPYELNESEKGYLLSFDLPGIPQDQIKVELKENQLRISGERQSRNDGGENGRTYSERRYGRFERVFTLPADVDVDKVEADYQDGVLHMMLPKTERVQSKEIKIGSGKGGFFRKETSANAAGDPEAKLQ